MTRKLPAGTCIKHAVNSVRNNIAYAFRISWPWYAVIAVLSILTFTLLGALAAGGDYSALQIGNFVIAALTLLALAAIAVNWHRYILLDEVPQAGNIIRLDGKTWRYLGNLLLVALILGIIATVVTVPLVLLAAPFYSEAVIAVAAVIGLVAVLFLAIFSVRLSVKLPAIALGRQDFTFSNALAATRGNNLALFLILLFQFGLAIAASLVVLFFQHLLVGIHPTFGFITTLLIQLAVNWILTILGITILTSLYGFFVEGRDF